MARCRPATSGINRPGRYCASTMSKSPDASRGTRLRARRTKVGSGEDINVVEAGFVRRPVLGREHRNPGRSGFGSRRPRPRRLARFGFGQRMRRHPDRAAEHVDRDRRRSDADGLDEPDIPDSAFPRAIEPGAGQPAGVGGDPVNDLHEVFGQAGHGAMGPLDGVRRQRGLAFSTIGAIAGRPCFRGDLQPASRVQPRSRRSEPQPGPPVSGGKVLTDGNVGRVVGKRVHAGDSGPFRASDILHPVCIGAISAVLSPA